MQQQFRYTYVVEPHHRQDPAQIAVRLIRLL
jgi:hypothetical protein